MLFYKKGSDELFTGQAIEKYRSGQTQMSMSIVDGAIETATDWYESGQKQRELISDGPESGHMTEWYENGQMKSQHTVIGGRIEEQETWDESGIDTTKIPEIEEAINLVGGARAAVTEYYMDTGEYPADNSSAGLSEGSQIRGRYVTSVDVDAGEISARIEGDFGSGTLVFSPTDNVGSISWQCSSPDLSPKLLPPACK